MLDEYKSVLERIKSVLRDWYVQFNKFVVRLHQFQAVQIYILSCHIWIYNETRLVMKSFKITAIVILDIFVSSFLRVHGYLYSSKEMGFLNP